MTINNRFKRQHFFTLQIKDIAYYDHYHYIYFLLSPLKNKNPCFESIQTLILRSEKPTNASPGHKGMKCNYRQDEFDFSVHYYICFFFHVVVFSRPFLFINYQLPSNKMPWSLSFLLNSFLL